MKTILAIHDLELPICLGWPEHERIHEQMISLNIHIALDEPPKACLTDKLEDTFCYSTLIEAIRNHLASKKFNLIEHVSHEIYELMKNMIPHHSRLTISITKKPKIAGFSGSVSFCYGDGLPS